MWMACTNRDTIKVAASLGLGALAFSFLDEAEARTWSQIYYDIIKSDAVRAARPQRQRQHRHGVGLLAARRSGGGNPARTGGLRVLPLCHFSALVTNDAVPGPVAAVGRVPGAAHQRGGSPPRIRHPFCSAPLQASPGIGTPAEFRGTCAPSRRPGSTRSSCCSKPAELPRGHLLLARIVGTGGAAEFKPKAAERERRKAEELAPASTRIGAQEGHARAGRRRHPGSASLRRQAVVNQGVG